MRAVVDTNVWVSAFLEPEGGPARILAAARARRFTPICSEPLLAELSRVLNRPRLMHRHGQTSDAIRISVDDLREISEMRSLVGSVRICRDPDDDVLIETAVLGEAYLVVSGDKDVHAKDAVDYLTDKGIRVVTVGEFLALLASWENPASRENAKP